MTAKLTERQQLALAKLTHEWESLYTLKTGRAVLDALVDKGYADRRYPLDAIAFPATSEYRLKREPANPG